MGAVAATGKRRGPMIFLAYVVGAQEANCYVVGDEESREALVIDPGENAPELLEQFREHDLRVTAVLATHHHLDHTGSLHELRRGAIEDCERTLAQMDDMYSMLVTVDYPDAMTGNLRRSTDAARGILERTRGDYTLAVQQDRLARQLGERQEAP